MIKMTPLLKSLRTFLLVLISLIIFAYGFQVTQVSFDEISSPRRQESLTRVIRALFRPDIFTFEKISTQINTPIFVPCTPGAVLPDVDTSGAYLTVNPDCADPRTFVEVVGQNFPAHYNGQLYFIPPSQVNLGLGTFTTDETGSFTLRARIPPRTSDQVQYIRTTISENVGRPSLSISAIETWNKIIETVFLALLATVFGIIFAVPISFFAARNLMRDITTPMSSLALSVLGWPVGIWLGGRIADWISQQAQILTASVVPALVGLIVAIGSIFLISRWALPQEEQTRPSAGLRTARIGALLMAAALGVLGLYLLASLASSLGEKLELESGFWGMMGMFIYNIAQILNMMVPLIAALITGATISSFLGRLGTNYIRPLPPKYRLVANYILGALAGAVLGYLIAAGLIWIYQFRNSSSILWAFILVGAVLGIVTVTLTRQRDALPIGLVIYNITRTILNGLRAIEALIWVIIFVIWVGTGPFAGALALALHTIASLAKLYSEQVESISPGPLEAIKATGATRLQVIIYSVIPQIIPPYISFTMYRWDINVRMSTIIGFAGGGGIGFLLIQNINLLNYRAASTQMLAIAIVVALMDYLSSEIRDRIV